IRPVRLERPQPSAIEREAMQQLPERDAGATRGEARPVDRQRIGRGAWPRGGALERVAAEQLRHIDHHPIEEIRRNFDPERVARVNHLQSLAMPVRRSLALISLIAALHGLFFIWYQQPDWAKQWPDQDGYKQLETR